MPSETIHSLRAPGRSRRHFLAAFAAAAAVSAACSRLKHQVNPAATAEEPAQLSTRIDMGDPNSEAQVISGLYPPESGSWRWSKKQFAVVLRRPEGARLQGARLEMSFVLPEQSANLLKRLVITARIKDRQLQPYVVPGPGEHVYSAPVPAAVLADDSTKVEFALSDAIPPGKVDSRELGIVVTSIWFTEP